VSVCIPFFEQHRHLAGLVAAFADQSYPDLEVVVVNDGSGPEASQEFDRVAAETRDARFRFLTTENRGPGAARNAAAEAATGRAAAVLRR
jgi:glycosyltransferase involved in cell wall biosynthesis